MNFTTGQASWNDIQIHLIGCDSEFDPSLSSSVNLSEYSKKIEKYSTTFEAWSENVLIGLIAAYFNDMEHKIGFITNVSVLPGFKGKGLASRLMEYVLRFALDQGFRRVELEVKPSNTAAIRLYAKFGFLSEGSDKKNLKMIYLVKENNNL